MTGCLTSVAVYKCRLTVYYIAFISNSPCSHGNENFSICTSYLDKCIIMSISAALILSIQQQSRLIFYSLIVVVLMVLVL